MVSGLQKGPGRGWIHDDWNISIKVSEPSGTCSDPECPYHGNLKVRGKIIVGKVRSLKMKKAGVIEVEYFAYNSKYMRYERRRSKIHVRVPSCVSVAEGDLVAVVESRPLSKNIAHVLLGRVIA